jgi:hypothetical protein
MKILKIKLLHIGYRSTAVVTTAPAKVDQQHERCQAPAGGQEAEGTRKMTAAPRG